MGFDKVKLKQTCFMLFYIALLVLVIVYSKVLFSGIGLLFGILFPFIMGGIIAFILNIPMKGIEEKLLRKWTGKLADKMKRPLCMVLSIVLVFTILTLILVAIVPQLRNTFETLGTKVGPFLDKTLTWLQSVLGDYPELEAQIAELEKMEFNWEMILGNVGGFLKNGVGNMLGSTITIAGNIIGGVVNVLIGFVFAIYILSQKEKLQGQGSRILDAYAPVKWNQGIREVLKRLYDNFTNFICGQCLEAVILGSLFIIAMTIFKLPYAVMIGTLIGFTSLIPVVGAFIGCGVGAFMILIENPIQALWFVILFLIIQQLEGNLIYPKVVGNSVGLPPIWVLMSVTVGGSLFGVAGMLVFIPLMSTLYSLLRDDVNRRNSNQNGKKRSERKRENRQNREQNREQTAEQSRGQTAEQSRGQNNKKAKKKKGNQQNAEQNGREEAVSNQEGSSAEQIVARLVAEQEVRVRSELAQEQQSVKRTQQQNERENSQRTSEARDESGNGEGTSGSKKKNNYYRHRNNNKRKTNTPQS